MTWTNRQIFLTVKAYPTISKTHLEACCMAGITRDGKWIRLYPVHFRQLDDSQRFAKFTWIEARVQKSKKDSRVESHVVDDNSIRKLEGISTQKDGWLRRNALLMPLVQPAAKVFREDRDLKKDSLAMIRVSRILDLEIEEVKDEDYQKQLRNLNRVQSQISMMPAKDLTPLEVIPYSFRYRFLDDAGIEQRLKIVDWEIYQLYRRVRAKADWQSLLKRKYIDDFADKDVHLFVGTVHVHPRVWLAIGVYYPPRAQDDHTGVQLGLGLT